MHGFIEIKHCIDALLIAQRYVGLDPPGFITPEITADLNCDDTDDIVDALLIAQYYVDILSTLCKE